MKSHYLQRMKRVRAILAGRGLDALLVTCPENRRYLSGFTAEDVGISESAGALLVLRKEAILLTDGRYEVQARDEAPDWRLIIYRRGLAHALKNLMHDRSVHNLAYEPDYLSCRRFEAIKKVLPETEFVSLGGRIETMRSIKSSSEIESLKKAIAAAEKVLGGICIEIGPGMTEKEIAWRIIEGLWRHADGPSFSPIVASGPNAALPHAVPTDRPIQEGEPVLIDMGARLGGYCSDMTRTIFLGEPRSPFREIYIIVRMAQIAAQEALKAGLTGKHVDQVARDVIKDAGYGPRFVHSLGHGVGLAVHEAPTLSQRSRKKLRPGMVVTVEPGIYLPDQGGVRLENMALVEADGATILSKNDWFYEF
jgi:Xaa-Pro aminopeptidase